MNQLFERFIIRLVSHALTHEGYQIQSQKRDRSVMWDLLQQRPHTHIKPDILVQGENGHRLPVDAKYKLFDERPLNTADIYQSFLSPMPKAIQTRLHCCSIRPVCRVKADLFTDSWAGSGRSSRFCRAAYPNSSGYHRNRPGYQRACESDAVGSHRPVCWIKVNHEP